MLNSSIGVFQNKKEKFDIISASGVFFHLEELHSATKAVKSLLKDDGIFVDQFIYLKEMVDNLRRSTRFTMSILSIGLFSTLEHLLKMHGLEIFRKRNLSMAGLVSLMFATGRSTKGCVDLTNFLRMNGLMDFLMWSVMTDL